MKKTIATLLSLVMLLGLLAGCGNVQTREPDPVVPAPPADSGSPSAPQETVKRDPVPLTLLTTSADEKTANVIRDQLKKAGFDVTVNVYPDSGTFNAAIETEQFDLKIGSHSGAGSPDANVRGPLHSTGTWNVTGLNDAEIDNLIDEASKRNDADALEVYKELEKLVVEEKAVVVPLYSALKTFAVQKAVVDPASIEASVGGARWVWSTKYQDMSQSEDRHYVMGINWANPNCFDCLQGSNGSTYYQRTNINVPLIQCALGGVVTTRGSLSKAYTVADSSMDFYFLLRTDVNFGTMVGGEAVDTGLPVSAEDVKYTFERAMSGEVPNSVGASYLSFVESVNIVSDMNELKTTQAGGKSVFDALNEGLDKPFTTLAADKYDADEDAGKYQVIHLHLKEQYPQQMVTLSAGQISIVCMERIEEVNKGITVANYDPNSHVLYGDPSTMKEGVDHGVYFSGPYVLSHVDDYGSYLVRNPGWNPEAEDAGQIKYIDMLAISDNSTQTAAFRNGELDEAMPGGENIALCEADSNINMVKRPSVSVTSLMPILRGSSKMMDENLRKAVLYAINTDEVIAVMGAENYVPAGSNLIMLNTGYRFQQDLAKSAEYLNAYYESQGQ